MAEGVRNRRQTSRWRRWRATWRDTLLLLRESRAAILAFLVAIVGGGIVYHGAARWAGEASSSLGESIYTVLTLMFLQPYRAFPAAWYLQAFHFGMPLVGIGILAQGLADFGTAFFNRRSRRKEWEMAVASTYEGHILLVGLGHLGYRVAQNLLEMGQEIVAVEINAQEPFVARVQALGIPVIVDDATDERALRGAGLEKARAIILCTQNDTLNLKVALLARRLVPGIRVVLRIFDDEFADSLGEQFGYAALSTTRMSASSFAAAASGLDITQPIVVEGETLSLARLGLGPRSALAGLTVHDVEQRYDLSVVLLRHEGTSDLHPSGENVLASGDVLAVLGSPETFRRLARDNG
jgi:Trk K+ transport system NAD-binding subunit